MTTDDYALLIFEQLKSAKDYGQVESILTASVKNMTAEKKNGFIIERYISKLQLVLETLSPLNCNSVEWSNYRYALIYLRKLSAKPQLVEN
jgi:hypothetical protein